MKKTLLLVAMVIVPLLGRADDQYRRNMPEAQLVDQLRTEKFPNQDAVVILKEQGFGLLNSTYVYRGLDIEGLSTFHTKVMIVKLLTQAGVDRYGTFSFRYYEWFGDEIPNYFQVLARVRKPDGAVEDVRSDDMKPKVSRRDSDGDPLEREVIFKIPNLAPGDVLQIEYQTKETFTVSRSEVFFYDEPDYVLFSNLFITLPMKADAKYTSIPEERIGKPQMVQLQKTVGAGETYFWSVRNLVPVTREVFAPPFEERAMLTSFVVQKFGINEPQVGDWGSLAGRFYHWSLDGKKVPSDRIEELGIKEPADPGKATKGFLDSLYTALRHAVRVTPQAVLYPLSSKIGSIFEEKKGDASDLSYAMYRILDEWNIPASVVLIRDRRDGAYEYGIPTLSWFDRLGVVARVGEKEYVYDFDVSVPMHYQTPWFMKGVTLPVITENEIAHRVVAPASAEGEDAIEEVHILKAGIAGQAADSVIFTLEGSEAMRFRRDNYSADETALTNAVNAYAGSSIRRVAGTAHNDIVEEPVIRMSVAGEYAGRTDSVAGRRTVMLANSSLLYFRDRLSLARRSSDIALPSPMTMRLRWEIQIPEGYQLERGIQARTIQGPRGAEFQTTMQQSDQTMVVQGVLKLPQKNFPRGDHGALAGFLDESLKAVGAEIVMKRK